MKCPNCSETLLLSERYNVQIDYCPSCRGVWLDKGELDKILEYANRYDAPNTDTHKSHEHKSYDDDHYEAERRRHSQHGKPYKKKSFLGDLFDFD